ncbi:SGNH/GDSL hydrolase family protein [Streptoalloteichus hindustanus]|uniref:GDSL-like Lipase/Acylhydrolase family protein n=1 Tax=Streptoalloteichus hindustanus TaxID=2017 RepID=A0A1M5I3B5_STRHI|nr:SGNH/GDSL hydrolase family protein [Streptoalloteichus hindustanus]SHG22795.1 GDSL-like Lipase/Acylhydrolase family protein [Streptoalloteichus hindustanus]
MGIRLFLARRLRAAAVGLGVVTALSCLVSPASAAEDRALNYVALGDSSAAGPLIPQQIDLACLRSDRNWPHVLATRLGARLTDVSCSGATTDHLAGRQFGFVPPQYDALRANTDLVTIAIGANDIGLGPLVLSCIRLTPDGVGPSCRDLFGQNGRDVLAERIAATAPKLGAALEEIHRRSPRAQVAVVGYLTYFQPGGCWPRDPVWSEDADYIQAAFDRLHAMLADQARRHGSRYVDIRTPSAKHGACAPAGEKWLEGLVPTSAAAPYHPNAAGMAAAGGIVAKAVRRPAVAG